jgi:hypothetical protein
VVGLISGLDKIKTETKPESLGGCWDYVDYVGFVDV